MLGCGCFAFFTSSQANANLLVQQNVQKKKSTIQKDMERSCAKADFHHDYKLGERLGSGGFAQVYAVTRRDMSLDKPTKAAKIFDLRETHKTRLHQKLHDEVSVWRLVGNNAHCVQLFDVFCGNGLGYVIMEKCTGTIYKYLASLPQYTERALRPMLCQMLSSIAHIHAFRIIHRDIKPDNFLIGEDGHTVKLADFGLSIVVPVGRKVMGANGTAPYMCPEMVAGHAYDEKADVWSFAAMSYMFLFGQYPYHPAEMAPKAMKIAILNGTTPSFKAVGPVDLQLRTDSAVMFLQSLLVRNPMVRPSAMQALRLHYMARTEETVFPAGIRLPSLKRMLISASMVGAFEELYSSRHKGSGVHDLLKRLQKQKLQELHRINEEYCSCESIAYASTICDSDMASLPSSNDKA